MSGSEKWQAGRQTLALPAKIKRKGGADLDELEFVRELQAVESRAKSNTHRIEDLEKNQEAINQLATSTAVMAQNISTMGERIDGMGKDIKDLKEVPASRWKFVVEKAIYIVVAGVMGFFLSKFGM